MADKNRKYICDHCKGEFIANWTEEEAIKEKEENFGNIPTEDCAQICDNCYKEFMSWYKYTCIMCQEEYITRGNRKENFWDVCNECYKKIIPHKFLKLKGIEDDKQ